MAIKLSEFLAISKELRKGVNPQEKRRQWQELRQQSQFKSLEKAQSIPKTFSPVLIVLRADPQKKKRSDIIKEKSN